MARLSEAVCVACMHRVDVTVRRFNGAKHVGMSSVRASHTDFYFGLALIRAHWNHARGPLD